MPLREVAGPEGSFLCTGEKEALPPEKRKRLRGIFGGYFRMVTPSISSFSNSTR